MSRDTRLTVLDGGLAVPTGENSGAKIYDLDARRKQTGLIGRRKWKRRWLRRRHG